MRILILGGDGYLGWPTAMRFSNRGHEVHVVDDYLRRRAHAEAGTDSLVADPSGPPRARRRVEGRDRQGDRVHGRRPVRLGGHGAGVPRVPAGGRRALRRDALGAVLHEGPRARRVHPDEQRGEHAQRAVRDRGVRARGPPGEARHDGRVRDAEHRHRGRLHHDRAQGPVGHAAVPEAAGKLLPPVEGARLAQHPFRVSHPRAACDRPEPGRRLRHRDRGDRARRAARHAVRLRRRVRHGAEPLLRPGGDRPPAHGVRQGRSDARLPQHRGHAAVRGARRDPPRSGGRVPRVQPVHRAVLRAAAGRARPEGRQGSRSGGHRRSDREPAGRDGGALLSSDAHEAARPRAWSRTCCRRR